MARPPHQPDPSHRKQVEAMAAYGIPESDIARVLGIDPKTLRKHYRDELDLGATKANAQVAGYLFTAAKGGNVSAQIFWLKTRARWREAPHELMHTGKVGTYDVNQLSDAALERIILQAGGTLPEESCAAGTGRTGKSVLAPPYRNGSVPPGC